MQDLALVTRSEKTRKKVLTRISHSGMISEGAEESIRLLQCTECGGRFSISAIREHRFYVDSMTCGSCYREMKRSPPDVSCFGKPKGPTEGYSEADVECRLHCRDRAACKRFVLKEQVMGNSETAVEDVDFTDVEEKVEKKKSKKAPEAAAEKPAKSSKKEVEKPAAKASKKEAAAEKPAKASKKEPAKAEKPKKEKKEDDRGTPPKEVKIWPYRNGSLMDYTFRTMLDGCSQKSLKKEIFDALGGEQGGKSEKTWNGLLKIMRRVNHRQHNWKLNEEGGRFKIYDVKCLA